MTSIKDIRKQFNAPLLKRGAHIREVSTGQHGRILSVADPSHVWVRLDGNGERYKLHPFELDYLKGDPATPYAEWVLGADLKQQHAERQATTERRTHETYMRGRATGDVMPNAFEIEAMFDFQAGKQHDIFLVYDGLTFSAQHDDNLHERVRISWQPEISGTIVGWRHLSDGREYLINLTVPYGDDSSVFARIHSDAVQWIWRSENRVKKEV